VAPGLTHAGTVALFPWGDVIEDFLEPIGLGLEDFAARMTGGWLFGYAAALQSAGLTPVIVCASSGVLTPRRLTHAGTGAAIWAVPAPRLPPCAPWRKTLTQWRRTPWRGFAQALHAESCSALLVQEYEYARFDALALLSARLRLPLFATFQGGDVTLSGVEAAVRPWALRRARGLIVASARERARLAERYGGLPLPVANVPNPLDVDEWRAVPRAGARGALGLPPDAFVAVSHGRIDVHRKGLDVLVDAWRRFTAARGDALPEARLVLIGSGPDREDFRALLDRAALPGVTWMDAYLTDRPELRRWLSAADAYVIASRTEGMPVAPLEAMACRLPVVSSRAHGLPEILSGGEASGGLLVACGDAPALAAALAQLAGDPERRRTMGGAARRRVEEAFSVPAVGRALRRVLCQNDPGPTGRPLGRDGPPDRIPA